MWPDKAACARLDKAARRLHEICGGRRTRAETIHLTLAFLGEVEIERIGSLVELIGKISLPAFKLELTRFGWWPHNRIVWAGADEAPGELAMLVGELREKLEGAGLRFDAKPFVPHITLLRKAHCKQKPLPADRVEWRVEDFVLVKSVLTEAGAAYEVVGRFPLT